MSVILPHHAVGGCGYEWWVVVVSVVFSVAMGLIGGLTV